MVIIRRNPDGTIASREGDVNPNTPSHPALATKRGMQALADAGRPVPTLMNEIATKVNNAKDKPRKLKVLKDHDSVALRQVLKGAFDPKIEWLLPKGEDIPFNKNDAPIGTKGGDNTISQNKRETLFIQMLEGLSGDEADFLITVVNKKVNNKYKGFTANLVKEAFDWNDNFMKKE